MNRILYTITLFAILIPILTTTSEINAQSTENRIFYIDSGGDGFSQSIVSEDIDQSETTYLWSSAPIFRSGYYLAEEDSVLLLNNSVIYKTDRQFKKFHEKASLGTGFSDVYSDFLADSGAVYFTSNRQIRKFDLESSEATTIFSTEGQIDGLTVSNSGTVYWAENRGFGNRLIQSYTADGDTLEHHTLNNGTYGQLIVDSADEYLYFVQDNFSSYSLNQIDIETGELTSLHSSSSNVNYFVLDESANKLYMTLSDRTKIFEFDLLNGGTPEEIFSGSESITTMILDETEGSIIVRTIDGVFDIKTDSGESERLTVPAFYSNVLVADPDNEYLYFVNETTPHAIHRTKFDGSEYTRLKEFNVFGTTFRGAHFDAGNNDLYLIDARRLYRMNLDDEESEETIITLDFGNTIIGFDINLDDEVIYYYLDRDGIYISDLDGEGYERISSGLGFSDGGIAYNPDREKIYFSSSTWIYSAEGNGAGRDRFHSSFIGFVTNIQYNPVREQIIFVDKNMSGIDRLRFRSTDERENPVSGIYLTAPSIAAFAAILAPVESVGVSAEPFSERPETTQLNQNYPNPFNPSTVISYQISGNTEVRLDVFDMAGRHVATLVNQRQSAGTYEVPFDGSQLSSGVYLYRLTAGETVQTRKLSLIK